ncbi:MAG: 50S ribosomal protein L23 [Candidatus Omnitrophica bacterium]|nr:50S ribosomal protein L23 [Candidatus Omnitrophota bacterium]
MKHPTEVIRYPLLTEKGSLMGPQGKYLFAVDRHSNKHDIKRAVEELYKVKVVQVNTAIRRGKLKRVRTRPGYRPDVKRAVVTLAAGEKIEIT